jgi:hypothetical protein
MRRRALRGWIGWNHPKSRNGSNISDGAWRSTGAEGVPLCCAQGSGPGQAVWTTVKRLNHKVRLWGSGTSENAGILRSAETWLHDRPHCSVRGEGPRPCTGGNARAQPSPRAPTERGGPPPLVGLSPGLCGPGGSVDIIMDRTVTLHPVSDRLAPVCPTRPSPLVSSR